MFYFNSKKELPSFDEIIAGLKLADEKDEQQMISLNNINEYWKILEKAFNFENNEEIVSFDSL